MNEVHEKKWDDLVTPDSFGYGWRTARENWKFFFPFCLLIGVLFLFQQYLSIAVENKETFGLQSIYLQLTGIIINSLIILGGARVALSFCENKRPSLQELFISPLIVLKNLIASGVVMLIALVPPAIFGISVFLGISMHWSVPIVGIALGIVATIIAISYAIKFQFYSYVLVDTDVGPLQALRISRIIARNHELELFGLNFKLLFANLLGFLCLGIGLFITIPMSFVALAHRYHFLKSTVEEEVTDFFTKENIRPQSTIA